MKPGLISIMMPVFNGQLFLPLALDCLLAQDYSKFEIVILDNRSSDATRDICLQYAARDARIRYVLDDRYRITHDAANHLATLITGEYAMLACDDDLWEPTFLGKCVNYLEAHRNVGLVFPNAVFVDTQGNKGRRRLLAGRDVYSEQHDRFGNFKRFLRHRRVVPTIFGVYRTEVMNAALPFDTFDETIADVDNLFILKILTLTRVHCIDEVLFYYRSKFRAVEPTLLNGIKEDPSRFELWQYFARHQRKFIDRVRPVIDAAPFTKGQKAELQLYARWMLVYFTTFVPMRSAIGRLLISWGLREGPAVKRDEHHEIRVQAHGEMNYKATVAAKENADTGRRG